MKTSATPSPNFVSPKIKICKIDGKGQGIVAVAPILRGTLLVREGPAITLAVDSRSVPRTFDMMSTINSPEKFSLIMSFPESNDSPEQFLSNDFAQFLVQDPMLAARVLSDEREGMLLAAMFARLAHFLPMGDSSKGLFPSICRANHACIANAVYTWNEVLNAEGTLKPCIICIFIQMVLLVLYAMVDISAGDEVEVSYKDLASYTTDDFDAGVKYSSKIESACGFTCSCKLCSKPEADRRKSERRLAEYSKFVVQLKTRFECLGLSYSRASEVQKLIRDIERQCIIISEEGHPYEIVMRAQDAFELCAFCGDRESSIEWLLLEREVAVVCFGRDSNLVQRVEQYLADNASKFDQWGILGVYKLHGPVKKGSLALTIRVLT